ncbi:MAG: STAS domain-containing protein [Planctomycetota bacterium]|jgi:anti-anti-sigma factor
MIEIRVKTSGDVAVLEIEGSMTHDTIAKLQNLIYKLMKSGIKNLILSMQKISLLLSTGIHFFVESHDLVEKADGKLILTNISREIEFTIKVAQLDSFFTIVKTLDDALSIVGKTESDLKPGLPKKEKKTEAVPKPQPKPQKEDVYAARKKPDSLEELMLQDINSAEKEKSEEPAKRNTGIIQKKDEKKSKILTEEDIKKLIKVYVPERMAIDILDLFVCKGNSFADTDKIADSIKQPKRKVAKVLKKLANTGILKSMGAETYNYAPNTDLKWKIDEFFKRWHQSTEHNKIFKLLLEAGK